MNDIPIAHYIWPGDLQFGEGAAGLAGEKAQAYGGRHVFLLVDPGVAAAGLLDGVQRALAAAGLAFTVYDGVVPSPDVASVERAAAAYQAQATDVIVALGGGSALDTAKAMQLLIGGGGRILDYDFALGEKVRPVPATMPAVIAMPTTAGTGSEVTPWGIVTDVERQHKFAVGDEPNMPRVALVDPALTLTLPPAITAFTGMDALTHCIEGYVARRRHFFPILDPIALAGIALVAGSLRQAAAGGQNAAARRDMALASLMGGLVIASKWTGACHSVSHPLSSIAGVPHGLANALMLPYQMEHGLSGAPEQYARISVALGGPPRPEGAVEGVRALIADLGLATRLRDAGVTEAMVPALAESAMQNTAGLTNNPRPVEAAEVEEWYWQAF